MEPCSNPQPPGSRLSAAEALLDVKTLGGRDFDPPADVPADRA